MTRYRDMTDEELIDWAIDGFKCHEVKSSRLIYALAKRLEERTGDVAPPAVEPPKPKRAASITELAQRRPLSREAAQYLVERHRRAYGFAHYDEMREPTP